MSNITIDFEEGANFITAREFGTVVIRCGFRLTDCGDTESLDSFVARHHGADGTAAYLKQCYRNK